MFFKCLRLTFIRDFYVKYLVLGKKTLTYPTIWSFNYHVKKIKMFSRPIHYFFHIHTSHT